MRKIVSFNERKIAVVYDFSKTLVQFFVYFVLFVCVWVFAFCFSLFVIWFWLSFFLSSP